MSLQRIRIATRESALAMWQARHVAAELAARHPGLAVELVPMTTRGDQVLDRSLAAIGGKGLFLKELEVAMQEGRADVAVHSLKDVPMDLEPGFALAAILPRADPFDAFISKHYATLDALPLGARVGTSSLRRQVQLRRRRPDLELLDLRGNVNTRLAKLDAGQYDAIILACAGMDRLGFGERIRSRMAAPTWLPAASQGAIAVECRDGDTAVRDCMAVLDDPDTATCVRAERAMNRRLEGNCQVPIAAYAHLEGTDLHLVGAVGALDPVCWLVAEARGSRQAPEALGLAVAEQLLALGANRILGKE